jgi:hypothetical protein
MAWLKKVNPDWMPSEKRNLQVGEVFEFNGPYESLIKGGMAILVDAEGNEQELPGQKFTCPICFSEIEGLLGFTEHVTSHRPAPKKEEPKKEEPKPEVEPEPTTAVVETVEESSTVTEAVSKEDDIRAKRLAALQKAREARMKKGGK